MTLRYISRWTAVIAGFLLIGCTEPPDQRIGDPSAKNINATAGPIAPDGMAVFRKYCVTCHGADGKLGLNGAKDLTKSQLRMEERMQIISRGKNMMTPFEELLDPEEIKAVAAYTFTLQH